MFKSEDIYRELQKDVRGLKKSTHKQIVTCQSRVTNVKPLTGMTSDHIPAASRTYRNESLPSNVKRVWHF